MAHRNPGETVFREFVIAVLLHNEAIADGLGLQLLDVTALMLLETRGPLAVGAISEALGLPSASTTRLIDRLERAGYVRRVRGERDRRTVTVELVEENMADYDAACRASRRHLETLTAHYGPEQVPVLLDMFVRVAEAYRGATRDLREDTG
ncbi:MarR family winged helix-turn-helix transcriptional regulator [Nonomuraea rhodomycinica]|uniref:MarR family transcriptional regulator n=1 Tax=Nonomuraea rhodomycinica TaxID=1712872 RepID=A0A7Y6MFS1_9ACTN|nr:MarR family transcriptional regulator [Nonomuraea rhodomycinica]NUW46232.1 MarR family transcriptional regulator [Nonomuraea rhodomycinica]